MAATTRLHVLVADGFADAADTLALLLASWGYEGRVAYNGLDAYRVAVDFRPDVALLKLTLPVLDGCELARRLRGKPGGSRPVCVAVTTATASEAFRRAEEAGFVFRFTKPADPDALHRVLAALARRPRYDPIT